MWAKVREAWGTMPGMSMEQAGPQLWPAFESRLQAIGAALEEEEQGIDFDAIPDEELGPLVLLLGDESDRARARLESAKAEALRRASARYRQEQGGRQ